MCLWAGKVLRILILAFFAVTEAVAESSVVKQSAVSSAAQQNIHNNGEFSTHRYSAGQNKTRKIVIRHVKNDLY